MKNKNKISQQQNTNNQSVNNYLNLRDQIKGGDFMRRELDMLALNETRYGSGKAIEVFGNGSPIDDPKVRLQKAKRKFVTQNLIIGFIEIAKEKKDDEMLHSLENTLRCQNKITVSDSKIYTKYCKNRFCTSCNSIRKGTLINKYLPIVEKWPDPHFLTLTSKAYGAKSLRQLFNENTLALNTILLRLKKRNQRGKGSKIIGIRALESNFNAKKRTYNPHFHIIVYSKEVGELIRTEWIKDWKKKGGTRIDDRAQPLRKMTNIKTDLIEVIKYVTTVFTEKNKNYKKKKYNTKERALYIRANYNIIHALRKKRVFGKFGFTLPEQDNTSIITSPKPLYNYEIYTYFPRLGDWVNKETGERLTNYYPSWWILDRLKNEYNMVLE